MKKQNQKGFLQIIILIIIALAILKFVFDFDIVEFISQPKVKDTISYIWNDIILFLWNNYIAAVFWWVWENGKMLLKLGWENLLILLDKIKEIIESIKN